MINLSKIPVQEIFGPTIQGEGNEAGQKTIFLRTAGCDYKCSWCDTKETWKIKDQPRWTEMQIVDRILALADGKCNHVTITGGNPALHDLNLLIDMLHFVGFKISMETQGSKWKSWINKIDNIVVSPKPPSSRMLPHGEEHEYAKDGTREYWYTLSPLAIFLNNIEADKDVTIKVPIFDDEDFRYLEAVNQRFNNARYKYYASVGNIDPDQTGTIQERLLRSYEWLVNKVIESDMKDVRPLPQLHTLIWANTKGV